MDKQSLNLILFSVGIILALTGAVLMIFGIPLSVRITIVIVGLALIATSTFKLLKLLK